MLFFHDNGNAFNKDDSVLVSYERGQDTIEFIYPNCIPHVKSLRIDPCEHPAKIDLSFLKINDMDALPQLTANTSFIDNGELSFFHDDPQLVATMETPICLKKISIGFKKFTPIQNAKKLLIDKLEQQINTLHNDLTEAENKLSEQNVQLALKERKIVELMDIVSNKQLLIQQLNSGISSLLEQIEAMRIRNRIKSFLRLKK
jgi:uncharacterized coiled-coil protein SlyX